MRFIGQSRHRGGDLIGRGELREHTLRILSRNACAMAIRDRRYQCVKGGVGCLHGLKLGAAHPIG